MTGTDSDFKSSFSGNTWQLKAALWHSYLEKAILQRSADSSLLEYKQTGVCMLFFSPSSHISRSAATMSNISVCDNFYQPLLFDTERDQLLFLFHSFKSIYSFMVRLNTIHIMHFSFPEPNLYNKSFLCPQSQTFGWGLYLVTGRRNCLVPFSLPPLLPVWKNPHYQYRLGN